MSWLELGLAVAGTGAIVLTPGLAIGLIAGLRGLQLAALAAPAGVSVVAIGSILAPLAGLEWSLLALGVATVAVGAVVALLHVALRKHWAATLDVTATPRWVVPAALTGSAVIITVQIAMSIQSPENISQTFDNVFHLNAIQFVLDTGNASPLHVGSMTSAPTGGVWYYPSGWHAVGSLVVSLTGASIPVTANALSVFFGAVAWPAGAVLLARTLFRSSRSLVLGTAAVAAAMPAFPLLMIDYGVLFPFMMGLSLVPSAVAAVARTLGLGVVDRPTVWPWVIIAVGCIPGVFVSHPGAFMALLVFVTAAVVCAFVRALLSRPSRPTKIGWIGGVIAYAVFLVAAWYGLRPPEAARTWTPIETAGQAVGEVITVSLYGGPVNLAVAALVAIGFAAAVRYRTSGGDFALVAFLGAAFLYIVVAALPYPIERDVLTGSWYNDVPRLAAILPLAWTPLAAFGASHAWGWLAGSLRRSPHSTVRGSRMIGATLLVLLVVITQATAMRHAVDRTQASYRLDDDAPLVSDDEHALLMRLPEHVPADAVIAGSPWTGTAVAYALTGREVMMPHTLVDITSDMQLINDELRDADPGHPVCAALEREGVEYVLDFGDREVHGGDHEFPGLERLGRSDAVELVDEQGEAKLYRVIGCSG